MKAEFETWHIHITGLVQGIGFRPFVYKEALNRGLVGWVKNDNDGLHVEINGTEELSHSFYSKIISDPPELARITASQIFQVPFSDYKQFEIIHDTNAERTKIALTPDYAICSKCRSELTNSKNRRYRYPFITCCKCGPRYSITHELPFDREHTNMDTFKMCGACLGENENPADRRYYAQTNSCQSCGIQLILYDSKGKEVGIDQRSIFQFISDQWHDGKIVAIKGIGGYLITCSAADPRAIRTLRARKRRPDKPLALMFPEMDSLKDYNLTEAERSSFTDAVSPIVLVSKSEGNKLAEGICDGLSKMGIMMPYAPLFQILMEEYKKPIVATSGNVSNSPIVFHDDKALNDLIEIADYILVHNRDIIVPQDDSVLTFTDYFKRKVIIRRSRGLAPSYFNPKLKFDKRAILAMGANLKSTFAIQQNQNVYISQYLGDLDSHDTQQNYELTLDHLIQLLDVTPEVIMIDLHPDYSSSIKGAQMSEDLNITLCKVPHHIAHFSALLGEHALVDSDQKIMGVIWDGTGLGSDDNIWGGEFFVYNNYEFEHCARLPYFNHLARDKMAREPRLSALALCHQLERAQDLLKSKFSQEEWQIYNQLLRNENTIRTSSVGRLFDAVASLLGILDIQTYEGQAASLLQVMAEEYFSKNGINYNSSYFKADKYDEISIRAVIRQIVYDLKNAIDGSCIAAKFHLTLVHWINHIAIKEEVDKIGFSGGVFQNTLLIDLILFHLEGQFELLFHRDLSPNDENISFGQLIYAQIEAQRPKDSVI